MQLILQLGIKRMEAVVDNKQVECLIKQIWQIPWRLENLVNEIRDMAAEMEVFSIKHIFRQCNKQIN